MDRQTLITNICPPLDSTLTKQLIDEYNSLESRFVLRDWEPATLDGGQFAEAASRILYHKDSGTLNLTKGVGECLDYVEDENNSRRHNYPNRKSALHTAKVIRTIYKFRSDRGAVHINPNYTANHLDATLVISNTKWVLSEFLRVFLTNDLNLVETIIRDILEFSLPVIGDYDGQLLVQRTDCNVDEEILILLHYAGLNGFNRSQLGKFVQKAPPAITTSLKKLESSKERKIKKLGNGNFRLTDIGNRFVLTNLADKLKIQ
jgi:hypothetical protein